MSEVRIEHDGDDLRLHVGEAEVGRYRVADDGIPALNTPKPYLHPLRTLGGTQLTGFAPEDHPWHHGLSFAFPRVGTADLSHNLWGGGTYFGPREGYVVVEDQGRIVHAGWEAATREDGTFAHRIEWRGHHDELLLIENRRHRLTAVEADGRAGWMLQLDTTVHNPGSDDLLLETPAQRGREDGGYGGWFLRFDEGFTAASLSADGRPVTASGDNGDTFVIDGRTAGGEHVTVGMHYGPGDSAGDRRWLYRFDPFSLAGFAVAYDRGLTVAGGGDLAFSHRIAVFDGSVDAVSVEGVLRA
jgi:hypothetical protein